MPRDCLAGVHSSPSVQLFVDDISEPDNTKGRAHFRPALPTERNFPWCSENCLLNRQSPRPYLPPHACRMAEMAEVKQPAVGLKFDPDTVAPIAAPFVLAPPKFVVFALFPFPIIGMNRDAEFRTVFMPHLDMPAITLAVANN